MCEISETEIRVNATLLADRDRLRERESFLIRANQETEDKRRETVRQLDVAKSTIRALQEALHNRDESIRLLHDQIPNRTENPNQSPSES
jgi:hypothetical protein